jgi:hypothetical protein
MGKMRVCRACFLEGVLPMMACLTVAHLTQAGDAVPGPAALEPASPPATAITPGKPKGAWQGEYPVPKPALPEGPSAPACEKEEQRVRGAATPGEPDERAGCEGAEPPSPD